MTASLVLHPLRVAVLIAAQVQAAFPFFVNPFTHGEGLQTAAGPSQIQPAAYAFSIWGVIYLLAIGYGVWQLLRRGGAAHRVTAQIAPLAVVLYLGAALWLTVAEFGPLWATMPILAVMAACATAALLLAARARPQRWADWGLSVLPFALYAGWTLCAVVVNIAEVAPDYGFDRFGLTVPEFAILCLAVTTVAALGVLYASGGVVPYGATVVWALVAIAVAVRVRGDDAQVFNVALTGIVMVASATVMARLVRRAAPAA